MRIGKALFLLAAAAVLVAPAAAMGTQEPSAGKPIIAVSVLPQQYFVDRIAQGRAQALVLVGPGQSPHSYEPTPQQIAGLGTAATWLTIGVEFEKGILPKVKNLYPRLQIVDTTEGVRFRTLEAHGHEEGEEEHEGEGHTDEADLEGGRDPHIWLGREPAKIQARFVRDVLSRVDPEGASQYSRNYETLVREIDAAFASLAKDLAPLKGKPVFVYHPSFGYFLDEFGIEQVAVELGGKEPTQKVLAELIAEAREHGAKVIFVQPQFSKSAAKVIAASIGGSVVEINPLEADWLGNLKRIGDALKAAAR